MCMHTPFFLSRFVNFLKKKKTYIHTYTNSELLKIYTNVLAHSLFSFSICKFLEKKKKNIHTYTHDIYEDYSTHRGGAAKQIATQ